VSEPVTPTSTAVPAASRPSARLARLSILRPLADRDFRLLWAGEGVSLLGDQFHYVALAWLVLGLTGSGLALSTVLIASSLPRAAFMLLGGALTDRFAPRSLMLGSNVLRAVTTGVLAVLVLSGRVELWHLIVLAVVFGTVDALFYPALNTIVAMLVPAERLPAANALVQGTSQLMGLIGPAAAGVLVAAAGTGPAFVVDAASFVIAAVALFAIRGGSRTATLAGAAETNPAPPGPDGTSASASSAPTPRPSLLATIREGAAYAFRDPAIRTLIIISAALNLAFTGPVSVGLAYLADTRFEGGSVAFGFMFAGFGGGAVIGAILAGSLARPQRQGLVLLGVATGLGIGLGLIGLAPSAAVATAIIAPIGLGAGYTNVLVIAWLQARIDPSMLGRVMSLVMLGAVGLAPLSLAAAGVLVDTHATAMFLAAGGLVLAAATAGLVSGAHRSLD
jgi:MFS family permease